MRFAKLTFLIAGIYGLISLPPLYFLLGLIGRRIPPAISHPEFYYGFIGVALAWQVAFLVIANNPLRFRPLMIPAFLEKSAYVAAFAVLFVPRRLNATQLSTATPDATLGVLFLIAFAKNNQSIGSGQGASGTTSAARPPSHEIWSRS